MVYPFSQFCTVMRKHMLEWKHMLGFYVRFPTFESHQSRVFPALYYPLKNRDIVTQRKQEPFYNLLVINSHYLCLVINSHFIQDGIHTSSHWIGLMKKKKESELLPLFQGNPSFVPVGLPHTLHCLYQVSVALYCFLSADYLLVHSAPSHLSLCEPGIQIRWAIWN